MGVQITNLLPTSNSEAEMLDVFVDYFLNKIKKIRDDLYHQPKFNVTSRNIPIWNYFSQVSEDNVRRTIMSMTTKSCKLDTIPTKILKDILHVIISIITQLMNISLKTGIFAKEWKEAVIRLVV